MKHTLLLTGLLVFSACSPVPTPVDDHSAHSESGSIASADAYLDRLVNSPRHSEWVEVQNGDKTIHTWVVYPERTDKAPVVVLIHENRGLNNWARSMADQVAEAGYIAVAPDMLSEFSAEFTQTRDFPDEDAARTAIGELKPENVQSDLKAVTAWAKTIPAGNGKIASAGFCWGGSQSFSLAAESDDLDVALVFYGTGPTDTSVYADIDVPVFGFYGGADERVNATIEASDQAMTAAGNTYDYEIYDGAGHAFMRLGEDTNAEAANIAARDAAWERMKEVLVDL
jgi:carboxymethylenebutenolidase